MRTLLIAALLACLPGCLSQPVRITPEHAQLIKRAAVVALLPDQPNVDYVGFSVAESRRNTAVLSQWDPNSTVETYLAERLRSKGFEVVAVDAPADLMRAYDGPWAYARPERIRGQLAALGKTRDVDIIVVVYRQVLNDFIAGSAEKVRGYGLFKHFEGRPQAFAAVLIETLDVGRGTVIGHAEASKALPLEDGRWRAAYTESEGPFPVGADDDAAVRGTITAALRGAVLLAAQEIGLSN